MEKNDRHRIDDRSRYILGWTNEHKIAALENKTRVLEKRLGELGARISTLQAEQSALRSRLDALIKLEEYVDYKDIDWRSVATNLAVLQDEKQKLESTSDILRQLTDKLKAVETELGENADELDKRKESRTKLELNLSRATAELEEAEALLKEGEQLLTEDRQRRLESMRQEALGEYTLTVESCDNRERDVRNWLQARIDAEDKKIRALEAEHRSKYDQV